MNLSLQAVQETAIHQTLDLIHLFELKGYTCSMREGEQNTVFVFHANREGRVDYTKEINPNWQVIRNNNSGVDWL